MSNLDEAFRMDINRIRLLFQTYQFTKPEISQAGIQACDQLLIAISLESVPEFHYTILLFLSNGSSENYEDMIQLTELATKVLLIIPIVNPVMQIIGIAILVMCTSINVIMASILSSMGLSGHAWEFLVNALLPQRDRTLQEIDWYKCIRYWNAAFAELPEESHDYILRTVGLFFYLGRLFGHVYDTCHLIFRAIKPFLRVKGLADEQDIEVLAYYAGILAATHTNNSDSVDICEELKLQYDFWKNRSPVVSVKIAETLCSNFGAMMGEDATYWARKALEIPEITSNPHRKTSMELILLLHQPDFDAEAITSSLKEYLTHLQESVSIRLINQLQRQRMSELVLRSLRNAINRGEYKFVVECAFLWRTAYYPGKEDTYIDPKEILLLAIPNLFPDKIIYLIYQDSHVDCITVVPKIGLADILNAKNSFEETWVVLLHQQGDIAPLPMGGSPRSNEADNYRKALDEYFVPNELAQVLEIGKPIRLLESTWMNVPLTALIGLYGEYDISSLVSAHALSQSRINKVLIWCDPDQSLFRASQERDAIENILSIRGVGYDVFTGHECTQDKFLQNYESEEYDVIWLICHGEFNHDLPLRSIIHVEDNNPVTLQELESLSFSRQTRRLVVLNACQSGMSSVKADAMGFMGLGPTLTNECQSVVGHLWSVDSFAAAVFGALLAWYLLETDTWGQAVNRARRDMAQGNAHVHSILSRTFQGEVELLQSLGNTRVDFSQLIHWGSPVIFE